MTRCFPPTLGLQPRQSNKHFIHLSTTESIYSLALFLQYPHFRSSRLELFCKKGILKNLQSSQVFVWHRCFLLILRNFKELLFSQNTSSGCFWHLHQSRFLILILYVIKRHLWRDCVQFFSTVETEGAKDFVVTCIFFRIITFFIKI